MLTLQPDLLATVVTTAKRSAADSPRWVSAIERAARELADNPWIEISGDHLLIGSSSGNTYEVNGTCQCAAYRCGQPCYHRACKQLVVRYQEAERVKAAAAKVLAEINELF